jgi:hypothetical protein
MEHKVYKAAEAFSLQDVLHTHRVPYTMKYEFKDSQRDTMEYWSFEISDPSRMFSAVLRSLYKSQNS